MNANEFTNALRRYVAAEIRMQTFPPDYKGTTMGDKRLQRYISDRNQALEDIHEAISDDV